MSERSKVVIRLLDGTEEVHTYVDTYVVDGVLRLQGRSGDSISYPLTSITSWSSQ